MTPADLFLWSDGLPLLLLVPVVWFLFRMLDRARTRRLLYVVGPRVRVLASELAEGRRRLRRLLATSGLLLALVAILQPVWGEDTRTFEQRGVDLLICLDVSRSMLARDLSPDRLRRATHEIRTLSEQVRGDRLGLVTFAGEARLAVPLTRDMKSFAALVGLADPLSVRTGGTDLGAALEAALEALSGQSGDHEAVILITDGEDLEQRGLEVAGVCSDRGVTVHCVGLGSVMGSKIAVDDGDGETFLRDSSGDDVVSAMDPSGLRLIAEATGGMFVNGSARPEPLVELYRDHIVPMARKSFDSEERRERSNRYQWPLLAAFICWLLELSLTDRKSR